MERIEYRTIDTAAWGDGPWATEPDKIQWPDEETGYPCLIVRNGQVGGFLCGYVGVPKGHPAYGLNYDGRTQENAEAMRQAYRKQMRDWDSSKGLEALPSLEVEREEPVPGIGEKIYNIEVHGGLTFSGPCHGDPEMESTGICHKPSPGEPDDVWWYGFDTGHAWDYAPQIIYPGYEPRKLSDHCVYRDVAYVTAECQSLAKQLKAMETA